VDQSDPYRSRIVDVEIDALIGSLPALLLEGAKGVGKTATATRRAATVWQLDDPVQRDIATADPARLIEGRPPVLIDEWQLVPETWDLVRRAVDDGAPAGAFLLTGSAVPTELPVHSGAGRIVTVRMRPLALAERTPAAPTVSLGELLSGRRGPVVGHTESRLEHYVDELLRSGFPGMRGLSGRALRAQLDGYVSRIVEREFDALGRAVRNPAALRRWITAYAAASSTTASFETIRNAATSGQGEKPARSTVIPYRDVLERLWVVDPLPAWLPSRNRIARLSAPPKHQLVDPALAARLLGVDAQQLLEPGVAGPAIPRDGTLLGALFESLVTLSVRVYAQQVEALVSHLRTARGEREIDLIVEGRNGRVVAIEVKLARTVGDRDARDLRWLAEQIGDNLVDAVIVTTGPDAYRRNDGIAVVPAALLGP
jgi:predicted AAA+ superfamily ATPase